MKNTNEVMFVTRYTLITNPFRYLKLLMINLLQFIYSPIEAVQLMINLSRMETIVKSSDKINAINRFWISMYFGITCFVSFFAVLMTRFIDLALCFAFIDKNRSAYFEETGKKLTKDEIREYSKLLNEEAKDIWK